LIVKFGDPSGNVKLLFIPKGWERDGNSPERSRIPSGMPVVIAPCPVVERPLNHRLFSLTPSGVDEQALRNFCETEIPSYTRHALESVSRLAAGAESVTNQAS
jgi:hypothetical protein